MSAFLHTGQVHVLRAVPRKDAVTATEVRDALGMPATVEATREVRLTLSALVEAGYVRRIALPGSFRRYTRVR